MMMNDAVGDAGPRPNVLNFRSNAAEFSGAGANLPEIKVRKEFPESWIYEDFNDLGLVAGFAKMF
jgi:hypothetical protein